MKRNELNKKLKFLSIAGAVMLFSSTMITADEANAGIFTRIGQQLRSGFRRVFGRGNHHPTTSQTKVTVSTQTTGSLGKTGLQSQLNKELQLRFSGIGSDGNPKNVTGRLDPTTGNSTTHGSIGGDTAKNLVVKGVGKNRPSVRNVNYLNGNDGTSYANLTIEGKSGKMQPRKHKETIYTKVKGSPKGLSNQNPEDLNLPNVTGWERKLVKGTDKRGTMVVWKKTTK